MRDKEFPFSLVREHGDVPSEVPNLNIPAIIKVGGFLDTVKKPVVDEVLGSYAFVPINRHGTLLYTGFYEAKRKVKGLINSVNNEDVVGDILLEGEETLRQVGDKAESAEKALGLFTTTAVMRQRALEIALEDIPALQQREEVATHCADAVLDFGFCLSEPWNIPSPESPNPKYSRRLADSVYDFGKLVVNDNELLGSDDGIAVMENVLDEQARRVKYFGNRYNVLTKSFGVRHPSAGVVMRAQLSDEELLAIRFNSAA